jgi:hypothetical protein
MSFRGFLGWISDFIRHRSTSEGGSVTHQTLVTKVTGYAFG